jgi:cephalosporin-C deacetylase-like acetyl esterase
VGALKGHASSSQEIKKLCHITVMNDIDFHFQKMLVFKVSFDSMRKARINVLLKY